MTDDPGPAISVAPKPADERWVRESFNAHGRELYAFARRSLGDNGLAEEAVQDTFVRAWKASDRFDENLGSLRTWLFAIIRNVIIDMSRARAVRPPMALDDQTPGVGEAPPVGDDQFERALAVWQVEEALRRLNDDHRIALIEIHYRGRTYEDLAAELGVPSGTLKSRVFYALKQLRLILDELGWSDD